MPLTKSAKKAYISSERKRAHNLVLENQFKKTLKKVDAKNINETISQIDKMAKRHIISKNKASRLKSRLAKKFGTPEKLKTKSSNVKTKTKKIKDTKTKKPTEKPKPSSKK